MTNVIYLPDGGTDIHTIIREDLNLNNRICKVYILSKKEWIHFKFISESDTCFSGIRLQQDQYNNKKFYLTDEKNKWHGLINDGAFTKGRWIHVFD